jgi:hypothetical protein
MEASSTMYGLFLATLGALVAGDASASEPTRSRVQRVTVAELIHAYRTNDAFADEHFSRQQVEVTGRIERILGETGGSPRHYQVRMYDDRNPKTFILFSFQDRARKQLVDLKPPQEKVTIRGVCCGRRGEQDREFIVDFSGCQVVSAAKGRAERTSRSCEVCVDRKTGVIRASLGAITGKVIGAALNDVEKKEPEQPNPLEREVEALKEKIKALEQRLTAVEGKAQTPYYPYPNYTWPSQPQPNWSNPSQPYNNYYNYPQPNYSPPIWQYQQYRWQQQTPTYAPVPSKP